MKKAVVEELARKGEKWVGPGDIRTVFDLLDVWVAAYEQRAKSPRTARHRRYCAERIGKHELGAVAIGRLDRRAIERYRDDALEKGAASTTREDLRAYPFLSTKVVERLQREHPSAVSYMNRHCGSAGAEVSAILDLYFRQRGGT